MTLEFGVLSRLTNNPGNCYNIMPFAENIHWILELFLVSEELNLDFLIFLCLTTLFSD